MKKRNGFVSNSSSSSFIVCHNTRLVDGAFDEIFKVEGQFANLLKELGRQLYDDLQYNCDGHIETYSSYTSWEDHYKNDYYSEGPSKEEAEQYKAFFDKWKYVSRIRIPGGGDGGTSLTHIMRDEFPIVETENVLTTKEYDY